MNQRDFGVPDVRCYDRALFAAVKCLALYCRSQIFRIEAASRRTREKLKGRFAVQGFFFFFWICSTSTCSIFILRWNFSYGLEKMWEKRMFSLRQLSPNGQQMAWGLEMSLSALLRWSARPDKGCEDISSSLLFRLLFTYNWLNGHMWHVWSLKLYSYKRKRVWWRYKNWRRLQRPDIFRAA